MSYKDIVVTLDPSSDCIERVKTAIALARAHDARLIGVDVCSEKAFQAPWRERSTGLSELFNAMTRQADVPGWLTTAAGSPDSRHAYAHYADLIVTSQPDPSLAELIVPGVPEGLLTSAGVPVLLLPASWTDKPLGEKVVIAWKAGREATRAVHDAMPLLERAGKVDVFTYAPEADALGNEADRLVSHLQSHGISAAASTWPDVADMSPVDALFACLDTQDADLIVAGAYGHARLVESLFGGVSHDLVRQPSLPVLLSH